jgi:hypothetical protein
MKQICQSGLLRDVMAIDDNVVTHVEEGTESTCDASLGRGREFRNRRRGSTIRRAAQASQALTKNSNLNHRAPLR